MLYSSGTTGYPKGIRNANPERAIGDPGPLMQGIMSSFGTTAETVYLSPAPLYHAATEGHGGTQISSDEWLSHIKCPKSIDFEAKLPRSDAGKLFKRKIRDRYWQGRDSAII